MSLDDALAQVAAALDACANEATVTALTAACLAQAEAEGPAACLLAHTRVAEAFDAHAEFELADEHARLAIANADAVSTAEHAALLGRAVERRDLFEMELDDLRALVALTVRLAALWPDELLTAVASSRTRLSARLPHGPEAEANERALIAQHERGGDAALGALAASEAALAGILLGGDRLEEAIVQCERVIARRLPPGLSVVSAYAVLYAARRKQGADGAELLEAGAEQARLVDDVPYSDTSDVLAFLLEGRPFPGELVRTERLYEVSHGSIDDPVTLDADGRPAAKGILSERVFGPLVDFSCGCGEVSGFASYGVVCARCLVEVRTSRVRRWRFGHIRLAQKVIHPRCEAGVARLLGLSREEVRRLAPGEKYSRREQAPTLAERLDYDNFVPRPEGRLSAAILEVLPVPPPDLESSRTRRPAVRAAYERVVAVNASDPAALQDAVDALFAVL